MSPAREPLRARKQRRTRDLIVATAFALFSERGFSTVTVDEIAERAEVGRTTFFRYFLDKQEVVFSDEQRMAGMVVARQRETGIPAASDLRSALGQVRDVTLELTAEAAADSFHWATHVRLLSDNPELYERDLRHVQRYASLTEELLIARGTPADIAVLAAQLGLACYFAGRRRAGTEAKALVPAVQDAFDQLGFVSLEGKGLV